MQCAAGVTYLAGHKMSAGQRAGK